MKLNMTVFRERLVGVVVAERFTAYFYTWLLYFLLGVVLTSVVSFLNHAAGLCSLSCHGW